MYERIGIAFLASENSRGLGLVKDVGDAITIIEKPYTIDNKLTTVYLQGFIALLTYFLVYIYYLYTNQK